MALRSTSRVKFYVFHDVYQSLMEQQKTGDSFPAGSPPTHREHSLQILEVQGLREEDLAAPRQRSQLQHVRHDQQVSRAALQLLLTSRAEPSRSLLSGRGKDMFPSARAASAPGKC